MTENNPVISIITSTYNDVDKLMTTGDNLISLMSGDVEWIVIDGASTDGTLEFLKENSDSIGYWVSEPDDGIYDAWNKGLNQVRGKFVIFLGAGDFIDVDSFSEAIEFIKNREPTAKEIYLGVTKKYSNGKISVVVEPGMKLGKLQYGVGYMHPGAIIPTEYYRETGSFDTKYSIASDAKSLISIEKNIQPERIKIPLVVFMEDEGVSSKNWIKAAMQYLDILNELKLLSPTKIKKYRKIVYLRWFLFKKIKIKYHINKMRHIIRNTLVGLINMFLMLPFFIVRGGVLKIANATVKSSVAIHRRVRVLSPWKLSIGSNTTVNRNVFLDARGELEIGENTMIGHQVSIYTLGHDIQSPFFEAKQNKVSIGNNVVIFPHAIIQPGVKIADGAVVLPGSVVTKNIDEYTVVGGSPAVVKAMRNRNQLYKLDYKQWLAL